MPERRVRFTEQFFDRLGLLLPDERGFDGTPSVTDFLFLDLPTVRDDLAADFEERTFATEDPEVRVYIGTGVLIRAFAVFVVREGNSVEAFWITIDLSLEDRYE